jgi:hypothetical protein
MASIALKSVTKTYPGNVTAVNGFDLEIDDKEFIVFVGLLAVYCSRQSIYFNFLELCGYYTHHPVYLNSAFCPQRAGLYRCVCLL